MRLAAAVVAGLAVVVLAGFIATILWAPHLTQARAGRASASSFASRPRIAAAEKQLFARITKDESAYSRRPLVQSDQIAGAYFAPWQDDAMDSFRAHAADLTHIYPVWLTLAPDGGSVITDDWRPDINPSTIPMVNLAHANGVRIVPILSNASREEFDPARVGAMLDSPTAGQAVIDSLAQFVKVNEYDGLQIDFELLTPRQFDHLASWFERLARALHAQGKEISITFEVSMPTPAARRLIAYADYGVVMAYDEHSRTDAPGPIASAKFVNQALSRFAGLMPPGKLVLGVGGFGYDWKAGVNAAEAVTNADALALAQGYRDGEKPEAVIDFDNQALEPTFGYMDDDGAYHEVWFQDASSVANGLTLARAYHARGAALWSLGQEDPTSWTAFGRRAVANPDLHSVTAAQPVQFTGDGELLRVLSRPATGSRTIERDPATGLINDESYTAYASGWVIRRRGAPAKTVAITFDDGPDPVWTPKILAVLKRRGVHATFFMIGQSAVDHPDLVRQVFAAGHEIGNHSFTHPNMTRVTEDRVRLELSACERVLESILGRQTTLFRPPFNADSEPNTYGEIMPVAVAGEMGYATAGESIDSKDWLLQRKGPDGSEHKLTPNEIVQSVLQQIGKGHAILLHDAGGDRSATVAALDPIITTLQAQGYRFVTIGELVGEERNVTMPALPPSQLRAVELDSAVFAFSRGAKAFMFWAFSIAIALGLTRIALMIGVASGRRERAPPYAGGAGRRVDVLVAAFNEAPVIVRTVESLLASQGVDVHVIVVDDGSSDGTGDIVRQAFAGVARVEVLAKPNGGKASALNLALTIATAPVVVGVDADTQLAPDALALLADWFADPAVGAVAGNVRVGNAHNLVTWWQSIEYVTSQNIDRRALSRLNAITVVPGAIGAWRRETLTQVGGYSSDTLAEDMDLTWRVRQAGWRIVSEPAAIAHTEAPDTFRGLLRQRFRWTYGTLQCLWKHRRATFHYGWFGRLALPSLWLFQIAGQILAPLIDVQLLLALGSRLLKWIATLQHSDVNLAPDSVIWLIVAVYVAFLVVEVAAGWVAYGLDRADRRQLLLLPTQKLVYRQIMYIVVWRALARAAGGLGQVWGKLHRRGSVTVGPARA